jgi:hypothetical protein
MAIEHVQGQQAQSAKRIQQEDNLLRTLLRKEQEKLSLEKFKEVASEKRTENEKDTVSSSKESLLLDKISKNLNKPKEQLSLKDINNYQKKTGSKQFVPKKSNRLPNKRLARRSQHAKQQIDQSKLQEIENNKLTDSPNTKRAQIQQLVVVIDKLKQKKEKIEKTRQESKELLKDSTKPDHTYASEIADIDQQIDTKNDEKDAIEDHFDYEQNLGSDDEDSRDTIKRLRTLAKKNPQGFREALKQFARKGNLSQYDIEQEFGLMVGKQKDLSIKKQTVSIEAKTVFAMFLGVSASSLDQQEWFEQLSDSGRISRQQFEQLTGKSISDDAWDFAMMRFNTSNVGKLQERAQFNNFYDMFKLFASFSEENCQPDDVKQLGMMFLTKPKFSKEESDLVSGYILHYEDEFIHDDYHLHDLKMKFFPNQDYSSLTNEQKETVVLAILMRMLMASNIDDPGAKVNQFFNHFGNAKSEQNIEKIANIFEYYFSEGGTFNLSNIFKNSHSSLILEEPSYDEEKLAALNEQSTISKLVDNYKKASSKPKFKLKNSLTERLKAKKRLEQ